MALTATNLEHEYVQVDNTNLGLDRASITRQGQIELPKLESSHSDDDEQMNTDCRSSSGMVNALKQRKHHAAVKIRKKLHIAKSSDDLDPHAPILANAALETESDSRLTEKLPVPEKRTVKDFLHNPIATVSSKLSDQGSQQVAKQIAAKEIAHGQEVDLINAHDAVADAKTDHEKQVAQEAVSRLIKERQGTLVRWSLDRHVTKVRLLPRETMTLRSRAEFEKVGAAGRSFVDWKGYGQHLLVYYTHQYGGQYIGFGSNPPAPSKETIMPNIERLIVATSPFQEIVMTTRRIYRWEDRWATTKYLLIYLTLWYLNLMLPGTLSFLLYLVIERRLHGNTLEDLRADIKHRENTEQTALSLNEFIVKRGEEQWADEIVDAIGPWLMVQLADLANFFESIRNFYEWRKPQRTMATLVVLTIFILTSIFLPSWLIVKSSTLAMGFTFFALFPLSVNYPEYRLLVSPTKRLLWDIPTHAEWAIKYIQAEGTRVATTKKSDTNKTPIPSAIPIKTSPKAAQAEDYGFYTAHHDKAAGHLIISAASCRFVSNMGHNVHFHPLFAELNKVEKEDRIVAKKLPSQLSSDSGMDLKLVTKSGQEYLLSNMIQRNEAFSQILGFSQATWQVVW